MGFSSRPNLRLKKHIDQIPTKGIAHLLTFGSPEMCILIVGKSGIQKDSCLYFYPYSQLSKKTKIVIDKNIYPKLIESLKHIKNKKDKLELLQLVDVFVKGSKSLEEEKVITCYLNSSNTGELIVINDDKYKIAFALLTNVKRTKDKTKFEVTKNLIPNSVVIYK